MANWNYDPSQYTENDFAPIPVGDHRVRINDVAEKKFSSGNEGFEITLDVSGYGSKLWFYLVLDASDAKKTNQRLGAFFDSFGITDFNLAHCRAWIGKIGAVRVKHEEYNGEQKAKVAFCLARKNQDKLPAWKGDAMPTYSSPSNNANFEAISPDEELPFD